MRLSITLTSRNINLFCLYRPPPNRNNQLTESYFYKEFPLPLYLSKTLSNSNIILGDITVHFDVPTNPLVLKISTLLNRYSVYQASAIPTHELGPTLDIAIFRPTYDITCFTTVTQLLSSDHYCVVCDLYTTKPVNHAEHKQSRSFRGIDIETFLHDIY